MCELQSSEINLMSKASKILDRVSLLSSNVNTRIFKVIKTNVTNPLKLSID